MCHFFLAAQMPHLIVLGNLPPPPTIRLTSFWSESQQVRQYGFSNLVSSFT